MTNSRSDDCDGLAHERELREAWQEAHESRHASEAEARQIASIEINRRLDDMNELRRQIEQERGRYLQRDLYDKEHTALRETMFSKLDAQRDTMDARLKSLEGTKSNLEGRLWAIGAMISAVVVAINLALRFWGVK